jgi:hypothetical protein
MKKINLVSLALVSAVFTQLASAQSAQDKQLNPNYIESCIQNQVQMHQKVKEISADQFRSFCECTSKQLSNSLNAAQLDELNKNSKRPAWLKSAEDAAAKSCLKSEPKIQA